VKVKKDVKTKVDKIDSDYVSKAQGAAIGITTPRLGNTEILGGGGCCCTVFTILNYGIKQEGKNIKLHNRKPRARLSMIIGKMRICC
jgi:hypothetical protein